MALLSGLTSLFSGLSQGLKAPAIPQIGTAPKPGTGFAALSSMPQSTPMSVPRPPVPQVNGPMSYASPQPAPSTMSSPMQSVPKPAVPQVSAPTSAVQPIQQATPAVPASAVLSHGNITTPSGAVVNPNTGALVSPPPTPVAGSAAPAQVAGPSTPSPAQPAVPSIFNSNPSQNPLTNSPLLQEALSMIRSGTNMSNAEVGTQEQLNQLNTSAAQAYTNAQGQPIPLPFITGQQAQIQREQGVLAQPLESSLALMQAQRQLQQQGGTAIGGVAQGQLSALGSILGPKTLSYGQNVVDPATGNVTATGGSLADKNALDTFFNLQQTYPDASIAWDPNKSPQENLQNAQQAAQQSPTYQAKSTTIRSVQLPGGGLGFYNSKDGNIYDSNGSVIGNIGSGANPTIGVDSATGAGLKADASSLTKQQEYADSTQRAFNTANANLQQLVGYMNSAGINTSSTVPAINDLNNKVKAGVTDPGTIAAFNAALAGLRAEYAQVLSRGGEVTDSQRNAATSLIPDNISPAQLQQVADRLNIEGTNAISEAQAQVKAIQDRMNSSTNFGTSGSSSSSGAPQGWNW